MDEHDSGDIPDVLLSDFKSLTPALSHRLACNVASDDFDQETLYYTDLRLIEPYAGDRVLIHGGYST